MDSWWAQHGARSDDHNHLFNSPKLIKLLNKVANVVVGGLFRLLPFTGIAGIRRSCQGLQVGSIWGTI